MSENETPNQGDERSAQHEDYLRKAAEACEAGDLVLGMHLYLAAYEAAAADPSVADGMAIAGLREAWHLACDLKERSMAEYVFEKLEPYLMPGEIAECAGELQDMALDRLEQIGFSREDLQDMAEAFTQDFAGNLPGNVTVKVESIEIPHAEMLDQIVAQMGAQQVAASAPAAPADAAATTADAAPAVDVPAVSASAEASGSTAVPAAREDTPAKPASTSTGPSLNLAAADGFNPYDMYRDYSIGKSWHAATNEGSGAEVFTRDEERAEAHERFLEAGGPAAFAERRAQEAAAARAATSAAIGDDAAAGQVLSGEGAAGRERATDGAPAAEARPQEAAAPTAADDAAGVPQKAIAQRAPVAPPGVPAKTSAKAPAAPAPAKADVFSYRTLVGYDEVVSIMRDYGVGRQADRGYLDFIAMLNERHGLDRAPALDTMLFRAPAIEDAARFVEATIGELGLPALRMTIEENVQGMPVLCVMTHGDHRPRMNHAHNRFEAPAVLVIEDLDAWTVPQLPDGAEGGMNAFVMANLSRGAREAVNLIRSAVEDPDVYVLATASTLGETDPFYYELLEPLTVVDIGYPTDAERADIWTEIARDHPSMRTVSRADLVRFSAGIPRYDIYIAARDAIEEAYKLGLVQHAYVPVSPQNIFEKLAACQPLDSDEYRLIEEKVASCFRDDLDHLEDLLGGSQD